MSQPAEKLDVFIIGTGMAGLVAGAILADEGLKVGLFDKHSKLGGYAQYFGVDVCWDATTHYLGGVGPGGWFHDALAPCGLFERLELLPLAPAYRLLTPEADLLAPADSTQFREALVARFPAEAEGLKRFFGDVEAIGREYFQLAAAPATEGLLADNAERTAAEFVSDYTSDSALAALLTGAWLFTGLPPERLSALHFAMQFSTMHLQGGMAAPKGGMRALTATMADFIRERGGLVENRMAVTRLLTAGDRVLGASVEDGRSFHAGAVLSTINPQDTFETLAPGTAYPPLSQFVTSISALQMHLLIPAGDPPPARLTLAHAAAADVGWRDLQMMEPEFHTLAISFLDWGDAERAPAGQHMVSLTTLAPYPAADGWHAPWSVRRTKQYRLLPDYVARKEALGDRLAARAAQIYPALGAEPLLRKVGTPITLERYTHNTAGAAFGWANLPQQCGAARPGWQTPLEGLYMAGHCTFPGAGIAPVALSARLAAGAILCE